MFRCAGEDRWIAIAATNQAEWTALCTVAGHPEWADDSRFAMFQRRYANRAILEQLIEEWTATTSVDELEARLQAAGIPAHRVSTAADLLDDPQLRSRGHWAEIEQGEAGTVTVEMPRFKLSRSAFVPPHPAPTLGQHNDLVLREILGMNDEEIAALAVSGALE